LQNLFFALWPDAQVRTELSRVQRSISDNSGRVHHPDDLHMTLVFLGRVDSDRFACIRRVAAGIAIQPFTLELTQVDYWRRPRILWCGPDVIPGSLQQLVDDLRRGLLGCGFEPENRIYKPHVTLVRKARGAQAQRLEQPVVWRPREFVLAGSHSGPVTQRYLVLHRWELIG
jgi:RNA 2',3'-cyclic 3'-phosphodiesterase